LIEEGEAGLFGSIVDFAVIQTLCSCWGSAGTGFRVFPGLSSPGLSIFERRIHLTIYLLVKLEVLTHRHYNTCQDASLEDLTRTGMFTPSSAMRGHCILCRPTKIFLSLRHSMSRGLAHKRQLDHHANQQKRGLRHQTRAASVIEKSAKAEDRMVDLLPTVLKIYPQASTTCITSTLIFDSQVEKPRGEAIQLLKWRAGCIRGCDRHRVPHPAEHQNQGLLQVQK
jgi:hypothetical protein